MPNPLTGEYDAVVQIAVRQFNGLLAALHQHGGSEDAPLRLLHSATLRIGDPGRRRPDLNAFADWVGEYPNPPVLPSDADGFSGKAPPGAATMLAAAFKGLRDVHLPEPEGVRGKVNVQISSPQLSVPAGSTSEVTLRAQIRAHYYPDPGTPALPDPIHGEVRAGFDVVKVPSTAGARLLIRPSAQDSKIEFVAASGSGLSSGEANSVSIEVRKALRESLILPPVDLPADFQFSDFKGVGTGAGQAIALPLQLSDVPPPAGALQSVSQSFIGASGFAFAVRREYVQGLLGRELDALRQAMEQRSFTWRWKRWGVEISVTYRFRFSSDPSLTFRAGAMDLRARVEIETSTWWAPNGYVEFTQPITLVLDTSSQAVRLQRAGPLTVHEAWWIPHSWAVNIVSSELDKALGTGGGPVPPAARRVEGVFTAAREDLTRSLKVFEASSSAAYTAVEVNADGIVVRGDIVREFQLGPIGGMRGRFRPPRPIVQIAETSDRTAFTAFRSWIPGGGIDRLIWSWVEHPPRQPGHWGVSRSVTDEHRFIFPKPAGVEIGSICLRIEGTQTSVDGQTATVAAGTTCSVVEPSVIMDVPSWWQPVTIPVWRPDVREGMVVRDAIAGHITVQPSTPAGDEPTQNSLVYFADWRSEAPLAEVGAALRRMDRNDTPLLLIVVVPAGTFDSRREEIDAKLASGGEHMAVQVHVTEDDEGGWTRTFAPSDLPAAYIINAQRSFAWKHEGKIDPGVLSAALEKHLVPAPAPSSHPLRLLIDPGQDIPDVSFRDDTGELMALHRLRGRRVWLNFYQSWSAPCLTELRRLQRVYEQGGREDPYVIAFDGGNGATSLDEMRKRLGLTFPLVKDPQQQIARTYGVRCWPTTISINRDGVVEHIQFGISPDDEDAPTRQEAQADFPQA